MSCARPLVGIPTGKLTKTGKTEYRIVNSIQLAEVEKTLEAHSDAILIPCGKCMNCRLDYSRRWADRMMLELETEKKAIFLTLTYDKNSMPVSTWKESIPPDTFLPSCKNEILDENGYYVPEYGTLFKRDFQLFMKRLRKELGDLKVRYFAAGEYGDKSLRPHYHLILYGISIEDFSDCDRGCFCRDCSVSEEVYSSCKEKKVKIKAGKNELGDQYYTSPWLEKIWKKGNVLFSEVTWKTCAYVARYVTKKWKGDYKIDYAVRSCEPEFSLSSRRPGIGYKYFEEHPEVLDSNKIFLKAPDGGLSISIPDYYLKIASKEFIIKNGEEVDNPLFYPEKCDMIRNNRRIASSENMKIKMKNTTLKQLDYLEQSELIKLETVKSLKRMI